MIEKVNKTTIAEYFGRLDGLVTPGTTLYIYGGAAVAALGANIRTTPLKTYRDADL